MSVVHPQANGQVEVTNRTIVDGITAKLDKAKGNGQTGLTRYCGPIELALKRPLEKHYLTWYIDPLQ